MGLLGLGMGSMNPMVYTGRACGRTNPSNMHHVAGQPKMRAELAYQYLAKVELHPGCLQKAALYRESLDAMQPAVRDHLLACDLPSEVAALIATPVAGSGFISEAHAHAYYLCLAELSQPTEVGFLRASYAASVRLFGASQYRMLMLNVSPSVALRTGTRVWQLMHRGSQLVIERTRDCRALVQLTHPRAHLTPTLARMYGVGFAAALATAGAIEPRVDLEACDATHTAWMAAWH